MRFRFGSLCSRFQAFRRQWDETLRKIEAGTYGPHLEKLKRKKGAPEKPAPVSTATDTDVYQAYMEARRACGQKVEGMDRTKVEAQLAKQRDAIRAKFGCEDVKFRVVVEDGKAKLKASRA